MTSHHHHLHSDPDGHCEEKEFIDLKAIERTSGGGVKSSHMRMILEALAQVSSSSSSLLLSSSSLSLTSDCNHHHCHYSVSWSLDGVA